MATIGHLAAGFAVSRGSASRPSWTDTAIITLAAAAPDVDFLMGIEHRGITHSAGAAIAVGVGVALFYGLAGLPRARRVAGLAGLAVVSHVLLDLITAESPVPALWPFIDAEFVLDVTLLPSAPLMPRLLTAEGALNAAGEVIWSGMLVIGAIVIVRRISSWHS